MFITYLKDARSESYDLGDLVKLGLGLRPLGRVQGLLQEQRQTLGVHDGLLCEEELKK